MFKNTFCVLSAQNIDSFPLCITLTKSDVTNKQSKFILEENKKKIKYYSFYLLKYSSVSPRSKLKPVTIYEQI